MKGIERTFRIGLASVAAILLIMVMTLGGLAVTGIASGTSGSIGSTLVGGVQTVAQKPGGDVGAVKSGDTQGGSTSSQQIAPVQQIQTQSGVTDARFAVKQTGPAVVTVINTLQQSVPGGFGGRGGRGGQLPSAQASGSGVIIDSQGDIITNAHVVDGEQSLQVVFADGTKSTATLVGEDTYSDIAVIKVSAKVPAVAQFGDSDKLEVGQPVVAIGTALGDYANTVTEGILSGIHRQLSDGGTSTQDLLQTDAAINHGNSGGPLLDLSGNVIGINTAVIRTDSSMGDVAEGLGFAIPGNTAMTVATQLMKSGSISHPFIGVTYQIITPDVASQYNLPVQQGVLVTDVTAGSPAASAGIVANSVITKFDGVAINSDTAHTLATLVSKHKVGDSVTLTVIAPGSTTEKDVKVVLAARPSGQ